MKKYFFVTLACVLLLNESYAQDSLAQNKIHKSNINYTPFEAEGLIPPDFIEEYTSKLRGDIGKIDESDRRRVRKLQEKFYTRSNYYINQILQSGDVIFGGPVLDYANRVLDVVLIDDPKLRSEVRVYLLNEPYANATTTDNGIIFLNTGLIARLENEAQLAYILSHEVIHYKNKHVVNSYVKKDDITSGDNIFKKSLSFEQKLYKISSYSKDLELESDKYGLKDYYSKTNYSLDAINSSFDMLMHSYLPYENKKFEKSFFETEAFVFPDSYFLDEVKAISTTEEYDDTLSTHPNMKKRKESLVEQIKKYNNDGKQDFIVSKEDFYSVRDLARKELLRLNFRDLDYIDALYNAYMLNQQYPNDKYIETSIIRSLLLIAAYKNDEELDDLKSSHYKMEGEQQQLYYLIYKLKGKELSSLALKEAWKLHKKYPNDKYIEELTDIAFHEITVENKLGPDNFIYTKPEIIVDSSSLDSAVTEENGDTIDTEGLSKYERIKLRKASVSKTEVKKNKDFYKYAFVDYANDSVFMETFKKIDKEAGRRRKTNEDEEELYASTPFKRKNLSLGIDKVIFMSPNFLRLNIYSDDVIEYKKTIKRTLALEDMMEQTAAIAKLDYELLSPSKFSNLDVDKFNDLIFLSNWLESQLNPTNKGVSENIDDRINEIIETYDTKYIAWAGQITSGPYPDGLLFAFGIPAYTHYTQYYFFLFNLETKEIEMLEFYNNRGKGRNDFVKSRLYNTFLQIKLKKKGSNEFEYNY